MPILAELHPAPPPSRAEQILPDEPQVPEPITPESFADRAAYLLLVLLTAASFFLFVSAFNVSAHDGADQNGYLVAAKQLAATGSPQLPARNPGTGELDPYAFVGRMWIAAGLSDTQPPDRYYPKYPIGASTLHSLALRLSPQSLGPAIVYWISPFCMALALLATFLLIRLAAGSLAAFLGTLILAVSPLTLALATSPDSHAPTLLVVTFGIYLLLRWWTTGGPLTACAAGLLLGIATTLRYSEALLLLPILLTITHRLLPSPQRPIAPSPHPALLESTLLLSTFSLPILTLLTFNLRAFGSLTGYNATNESIPGLAFRFDHFLANAQAILRQLHDTGLTFILPFSIAGLLYLFARNARLALLLTLWIVPPLILHAFYYWAPDHEALPITYLRLVLTILPPLILCATSLLPRLRATQTDLAPSPHRPIAPSPSALLATLAILTLSTLLSTRTALQLLESDQSHRLALASDTDLLRRALHNPSGGFDPPPLLLITHRSFANHLQYALPARLCDATLFDSRHVLALIGKKSDKPKPDSLDPRRPQALERYLKSRFESRFLYSPDLLSPTRWIEEMQHLLAEDQQSLIRSALASGRRVFYLHQTTRPQDLPRAIDTAAFSARIAAAWQTYTLPQSKNLPDTLRTTPARASASPDSHRQYRASWQLIEISALPPATQPTTAPTAVIPDPDPVREGQ